jgi:hypothetical protein
MMQPIEAKPRAVIDLGNALPQSTTDEFLAPTGLVRHREQRRPAIKPTPLGLNQSRRTGQPGSTLQNAAAPSWLRPMCVFFRFRVLDDDSLSY